MKVLLILADGMRPDALTDLPQVEEMKKKAAYTMDAQTVFPSVTLPCHVSLFHSVPPMRHGTTTNTYAQQVRPVDSLFETLAKNKKHNAMFYSWDELRDLCVPGCLAHRSYWGGWVHTYEKASDKLTEEAIAYMKEYQPDFTFLYMGDPDSAGHGYGWMGEEYMRAVRNCWQRIEKVLAELDEDYTVIITADHGGHDRTHGTELPEDMTIPVFVMGKDFEAGKELENVNIMDIAPTVTKLLGVAPDSEWEGKSLID